MIEDPLHTSIATATASCLQTLGRGEAPDLDELSRSLGSALEYLLCRLLETHPETRRYWVDGVLIREAQSLGPLDLRISGEAICADHRTQWSAPVEASIVIRGRDAHPTTEPMLERCTVRLGDAESGTLENQARSKSMRPPEEWLFTFEVDCAARSIA